MSRRLNRSIRWGTLLALVLATLAPGIAHALRDLRGETMPWSVLCSASDGKRVVFDAAASDDGSIARAHAFEHCASCALHHDVQAPPMPAATPMLRVDLAQPTPQGLQLAPQRRPEWRQALTRAPPQHA
ncbi:MAG TPA: DUF2946 domain-containing protein [Burkholderiaceae bacterium]|nr:DUF2946 domain-containing protein [Burkholderiaceae bacterium]